MRKSKLIEHLRNDIYCRIGVSKINGVGVIAIRDIPPNTNPFKSLSNEKEKIIELNNDDLKGVDKNITKLLGDFFGSNNGNQYDVLCYGPNHMNVSFYMNHSDTPNISIINDGSNGYMGFVTNRLIKENEELTINYGDFDKL